MRIRLVGDVPSFCIGAQHQAGNARAIAERIAVEFGVRVRRVLRVCAAPLFDDWRVDMIEPPAPIVPGDEDYAKRLERGRFIWPSPADGVVAITAAQLAYMLEGIDWRNPLHSWRPHAVG